MVGMENLVPKWLHKRDLEAIVDDQMHVPEIAKVEPPQLMPHAGRYPQMTNPDHEASVVVQAHQFVEQWKASSALQQKTIENLQIENTELTLQLEGEKRKNGVLEADLATAANTIQSLEIERSEYRQFFSVSLDIKKKELSAMERFGIVSPPKKERKPNGKATKAKRQETPEAASENRTETKEYHGA
jgi:hypothetical protein